MFDELPEEWRIVELGEIATIKTGKTPSTREPAYWGGAVPFVTPSDMIDSPNLRDVERSVTNKGAAASVLAPAGSVLFTCIASIGKSCIISESSAFNQQINACLPNANVDSYFLFYALSSRIALFKSMAGTTAVPIINKSNFSKTEIIIPPLIEQRRISEVLGSIDAVIALDAEILGQGAQRGGTLRELKARVMADLLFGRVRVPA